MKTLGKKFSKETRNKMSKNNARFWKGKNFSKEHKNKLSLSHSGINHMNYGKHLSEETKKKISAANKGKKCSIKTREKMSKRQKGKTYEELYGVELAKKLKNFRRIEMLKQYKVNPNMGTKGIIFSKETTRKRIESRHNNGKPWHSDETKKKIIQSLCNRPTSFEKKISDLCIIYHLPYVYTGNGIFFIGNKNPDFADEDNKIAIEVYYDYFKIKVCGSSEEYERQRREYFAKHGWKVIFINQNAFSNKNWKRDCMNKILNDSSLILLDKIKEMYK